METQAETSSTSRRLPDQWVAKIFRELQGNYGSRFLNQWKTGQALADGTDAGVRNAMNVWAEKLGGFLNEPKVFGDVLANLPEEPPNLPEFVALCRGTMLRARDGQQAIAHKLTPEEKAHNQAMAEQALKAAKVDRDKDFLDWAKKPRSRMAFEEVRKLANATGQKADARFREILDGLIADGRATAEGHLLMLWNCQDWVKA